MINSATGAPANYAELAEHYTGFIRSLVIKAGIRVEDADDITQEMLTKFMEKDALAWYDGEMLHTHGDGRPRKARFLATFLAGFVGKYVMQARDKQMTYARKQPLRLEYRTAGGEEWGNIFAECEDEHDHLQAVETAEWVASAERHLASIPPRGRRDLARVFRMVVAQTQAEGRANRREIATEFGVSDTTVCSMFRDIRVALIEAGFKDVL